MKNLCLYLFIFLCNSAAFSQPSKRHVSNGNVKFTDGSRFEITQDINSEKLPVNIGGIKIYNKTVRGSLYDFGEPSFSISKNAITAISKKNRALASQIRSNVYLGIGIQQDGNSVRLHAFRSVKNLNQLSVCVQSKSVCQVEAEAVVVQIKMKDGMENFVLLKAIKPTTYQN